MLDGLGTKIDPLASDEDGGADLESQIGVEHPHDRGHSGNRGCTKRLLATVLDSEVEECIGSGETAFRDERMVEQRLVIDPLGLPGIESVWIFQRRWCRPRGGAGSLSFGRGRLPGSHGSRSRGGDLQTQKKKKKKNERGRGKGCQKSCGGKNKKLCGYL